MISAFVACVIERAVASNSPRGLSLALANRKPPGGAGLASGLDAGLDRGAICCSSQRALPLFRPFGLSRMLVRAGEGAGSWKPAGGARLSIWICPSVGCRSRAIEVQDHRVSK